MLSIPLEAIGGRLCDFGKGSRGETGSAVYVAEHQQWFSRADWPTITGRDSRHRTVTLMLIGLSQAQYCSRMPGFGEHPRPTWSSIDHPSSIRCTSTNRPPSPPQASPPRRNYSYPTSTDSNDDISDTLPSNPRPWFNPYTPDELQESTGSPLKSEKRVHSTT